MIEQHQGSLAYQQFTQLLPFPAVTHGIFTRLGGQSEGYYSGLNTSAPLHKGGDTFENVVHNRQLALQALDVADFPCATLWQVHGADVAVYDPHEEWRTDWAAASYYERPWSPSTIRKADALISRTPEVALALSFADCTPILFYDPVVQAIGLAHAGWRGTARAIAVATVEALQHHFGSRPEDIYAGIGTCIGPCCYEISEEVRAIFLGQQLFPDLPTQEVYRPLVREAATFETYKRPDGSPSLRLDLRATNAKLLQAAGVLPEHIEISQTCTADHTDLFFSHRAEDGKTGRFPAIIALR